MPQVLVTQRIENLERRTYAVGAVVTFADAEVVNWLKGQRKVDDTPAVVAAAVASGVLPVTHVPGVSSQRQVVESEVSADGVVCLSGLADAAVRGQAAAAFTYGSRPLKVGIIGASRDQGQWNICPHPRSYKGWWANRASTQNTGGFLTGVNFPGNCAATDTATVNFSATLGALRVAVNGDVPGPWVPIAGKAFPELDSGLNGKFLFIGCRNRFAPTSDQTWVFANASDAPNNTPQPCRNPLSALWTGIVATLGLSHHDVTNMAMGEDRAEDVYNRIDEFNERGFDIAFMQLGENTVSDSHRWVKRIIDKVTARGTLVVLSKTLPANWSASDAVAWAELNRQLEGIAAANPKMYLVDLGANLRNPAVQSGAGFVIPAMYNPDGLHTALTATLTRVVEAGVAGIRRLLPFLRPPRALTPGDGFNAATNPLGNLVGERALLTGGGGIKGAGTAQTDGTPAAGELPDFVTAQVLGGTFASTRFFAPASANPVPRSDHPGRFWAGAAMAGASANGTTLFLTLPLEFAPTPGGKYRARVALKLLNALGLSVTNGTVSFTNSTGLPSWRMMVIGTLPSATAVIGETDTLYLDSGVIEVPAGTTGASIAVAIGVVQGGGFTVLVADPALLPA